MKKALALAMAVFIACASVPVAMAEYENIEKKTTTVNGKDYVYFSDGTKFHRSGSGSNAYLNIWEDNHYRFMLTEENQTFYFIQNLRMQHQYELLQSKSTYFDKFAMYTGQSFTGTPDEAPTEAQKNATIDLIENNDLQEAYWTPANDNAQEKVDDLGLSYVKGTIPAKYEFHANAISGGNKNYYWDGLTSFKATKGFTKTFYNATSWYENKSALDSGVPTNYVVFGVTLEVVDVLPLKNEVKNLKEKVAAYESGQSQDLTETRYLTLKKYIDAVPESMLDGTQYYSQAAVDAMYAYVTETATGLADYSEYDKAYTKADKIVTYYSAGYTDDTVSVLSEILKANKLDKTLLVSEQSVVDEATLALKNGLSGLIAKTFHEPVMNSISNGGDVWDLAVDKTSNAWENGELDVHIVGTKFEYMQTYDDQQFHLYQWVFMRSQLSPPILFENHPTLLYFVFDTNSCGEGTCFDATTASQNNSTQFVSRLPDKSKAEHTEGIEYAEWEYVKHNTRYYENESISNATALCSDDGTIDEKLIGENGAYARNTFLADANMYFTGEGSDTQSYEQNLSFAWKFGVNNNDKSSNIYHYHVPVSVLVTDARDLIKLYDELSELTSSTDDDVVAKRLSYTEESINAVRAALDTIPEDLVFGGVFYTQEKIDEYYNTLLNSKNALEPIADYTEYDATYLEAEQKTNDELTYEPGAFNSFRATITNINENLDRRIGETQQSVVNEATQQLKTAMKILEENAYCDYSVLDYLINYAEENFTDNSDNQYSQTIYEAIIRTLEKAKSIERGMVKGENNANQLLIDEAADELLQSIYYDYFDTISQDAIATENKDGEKKLYTDAAFEKFKEDYKNATEKLEANINDVNVSDHDAFEEAVQELYAATSALEENKFVDLTELNNVIAAGKEVVDGAYTDSTRKELQDAITKAEEIVAKNPVYGPEGSGQKEVDIAIDDILNAIERLELKADYTALNEAIAAAEATLADTTVVYTESSKKALEEAYQSAISLNKDLPATEQATVDAIVSDLVAANNGIKVKADYTALDEAISKATEALSQTDVIYTEATKQLLENALSDAQNINRDLSTDDQNILDEAAAALKNATEGLKESADLSDYKEALEKVQEILGNNNADNRYDEDDYRSFVDIITGAITSVGEDTSNITKDEQGKVDSATEAIKNATTEIYNKRYIFVEFRDEANNPYKSYRVQYNQEMTFALLEDAPQLPQTDAFTKYSGWFYGDGSKMSLTDAITDDVFVYCIAEEIKLVSKENSLVILDDEKGFFKGLKHNSTVDALLDNLKNDLEYVIVRDMEGNIADDNSLIATGMTVELMSKTNNNVVHEEVTVIVRGDVNGDGLVNDEDYEKSKKMCLKEAAYSDSESAFFEANDTDGDGVLDVIDLFNISNMRYGN